MRLGAPVENSETPEGWIQSLQKHGYRAAYCPFDANTDHATRQAYLDIAHRADIIIAEVGAWSNPLSPDSTTRQKAIAYCQEQLVLADDIGARCCVNISGALGEQWDGAYASNFADSTFDLIVETVRKIIDAVRPKRTFYTLETMTWMLPDSIESYLMLIRAIDRPQFAVHLDPVNLINSPRRYFGNKALLEECFSKLGRYIKSCHGKDVILDTHPLVHLREVRPGLGHLDYVTFLICLNQLADVPLMLEHLPMDEYPLATAYVQQIASQNQIVL